MNFRTCSVSNRALLSFQEGFKPSKLEKILPGS